MDLSADSRFNALKQGDHVCAFYEHPAQQVEAIIRYLKSGLFAGERCIYILGERSQAEIQSRLSTAGVDVGAALDADKLIFKSKYQTYLDGGAFDPDRMIRLLRDCEAEALSAGCSGLRVSGEMTWALEDGADCDRIHEYESRLNEFYPRSRTVGLCQYNRSRFSPRTVHEVLRTHPIVTVDQSTCSNPFYEPPHLAVPGVQFSEHVDWLLQQLVEFRVNEIEAQSEIAERDVFLSSCAKELRNPLHTLNLALHTAGRGSQSDEFTRRNIARAQRQADRLTRLISMMLDASLIRSGSLDWTFEPVNLMQLARVSVAYFEHEAKRLGYTIRVEGEPAWGNWDAERIGQILHYLLSNAVKFGGGRPIEVTVVAHDEFAELAVIDHGIGIDPQELPQLFDRIGRVSSASQACGMRLGLWMVHKLVGAMQGSVRVESEFGRGSRFLVRLPFFITTPRPTFDA